MPTKRESMLTRRLGYEIPLIIVLTSIAFMYTAGNLMATESLLPWRVIIAHSILLVVGIAGLVYIRDVRSGSATMPESPKRFLAGIAILALPPSFIALMNPPLEWFVNLQLSVFFIWAATVENVVFFYVFPSMLVMYGVSARRSWIGGVLLWLLQHSFVWNLSIGTIAMGFVFGMLQALVFEWTGSFVAICWAHGVYNASLMGVNWIFLIMMTVIFIIAFMMRWYGERRGK